MRGTQTCHSAKKEANEGGQFSCDSANVSEEDVVEGIVAEMVAGVPVACKRQSIAKGKRL